MTLSECPIDRQSHSTMFQRFEDYFGGDISHELILRKADTRRARRARRRNAGTLH